MVVVRPPIRGMGGVVTAARQGKGRAAALVGVKASGTVTAAAVAADLVVAGAMARTSVALEDRARGRGTVATMAQGAVAVEARSMHPRPATVGRAVRPGTSAAASMGRTVS